MTTNALLGKRKWFMKMCYIITEKLSQDIPIMCR